jgi:hypothetical protein
MENNETKANNWLLATFTGVINFTLGHGMAPCFLTKGYT